MPLMSESYTSQNKSLEIGISVQIALSKLLWDWRNERQLWNRCVSKVSKGRIPKAVSIKANPILGAYVVIA